MDKAQDKHQQFHDRRFWFCVAIVLLDIGLSFWAKQVFADPGAGIIFLLPALPLAAGAISHYIASGLTVDKCPCGFGAKK